MSSIDLNNPDLVRRDEDGKSPAFFCKKYPVKVNDNLLAELETVSEEFGGQNVRFCLHESPASPFHDMIILERKGKYYPPHKHLTKGESFHIVKGKLAVFTFNDLGDITDACLLEDDGHFIYKVGVNMYHAVMPISDKVIYHESKPGPFLGEKDSILPEWAPDQHENVQEFQKRLLNAL